METLGNNLVAFSGKKVAKDYYCEICDYKCNKKYNWEKHLTTRKHLVETSGNHLETKNGKEWQKEKYQCENCNKIYQNRSGLWKHNKTCVSNEDKQNDNINDKELMMMILKQNADIVKNQQTDLKEFIVELVKSGITNHSHNNNHTNSHNKTFNLNFFLNETCKNAMNIEDFVEQIVLNLNDLEETGRLGFAEGVSKMILSRLNKLDVTERPIHCSDLKRETLYIKDKNKWEKEEETKPKLTKAVKEIAGKNMKQIFDWQKKHPDYNDPTSRTSDKYMNMVMNSMSGGTEQETQDNYEKIVSNITKEATIDKEQFAV